MKHRALLALLIVSLLSLSGFLVDAQSQQSTAPKDDLFRTIAALDASVFDAFNRCDLEKFGSFFTDDLEFYHDQGGLTRSRQSTVEAVKNNICGKVTRELVPGTLEVYPMKGYGAVEIGVHRFHHPGREDTEPVGEAKFIHLWENKDGAWKITRVISYDHHALAK
jgi:ketosteroid isomerase-like protein